MQDKLISIEQAAAWVEDGATGDTEEAAEGAAAGQTARSDDWSAGESTTEIEGRCTSVVAAIGMTVPAGRSRARAAQLFFFAACSSSHMVRSSRSGSFCTVISLSKISVGRVCAS